MRIDILNNKFEALDLCAMQFFFSSASNPPLANCLELQLAGYAGEGVYWIDPSGQERWDWARQVKCKEGWTYILTRGQYGNPVVRHIKHIRENRY